MTQNDSLTKHLEKSRSLMRPLEEEHRVWIKKWSKKVAVTNSEELARVVDGLHYAKKASTALEDLRKSVVQPFQKVVKDTNDFFKESFVNDLEKIITWTSNEVNRFTLEERVKKESAIAEQKRLTHDLAEKSILKQIEKGVDPAEAKRNVEKILEQTDSMIEQQNDNYSSQSVKKTTMGKLVTSTIWSFDVEASDLLTLIKHIANNPADINLVDFNSSTIQKLKPTKTFTPAPIPGIVYKEKIVQTAR